MKNFKNIIFSIVAAIALSNTAVHTYYYQSISQYSTADGKAVTCINGNCYEGTGSNICINGTCYCDGVELPKNIIFYGPQQNIYTGFNGTATQSIFYHYHGDQPCDNILHRVILQNSEISAKLLAGAIGVALFAYFVIDAYKDYMAKKEKDNADDNAQEQNETDLPQDSQQDVNGLPEKE